MTSTDGGQPQRIGALLPTLPPHVAEALAQETEEARKAGAIGYMARVLAQATMPHSKPAGNEYTRTNGLLTLTIMAPSAVGLPYGSIPRLVLAWVTTEAVRTRSRQLILGHRLSDFMRQLDLVPTGGRWGTIPRLRQQLFRLFASSITCLYARPEGAAGAKLDVASDYQLWWHPRQPGQGSLWQSTVTLGERFFAEIIERPVPVDMRALRALRRSPLALDLYVWLTYRMSYLRQPTAVPWAALRLQFGADYGRMDHFQGHVRRALAKYVLPVYPQARIEEAPGGLRLLPSPTHVRQLGRA